MILRPMAGAYRRGERLLDAAEERERKARGEPPPPEPRYRDWIEELRAEAARQKARKSKRRIP